MDADNSAQILIDFINHYNKRNRSKSVILVNKFNQQVGYQITISNDYSNVKTYLLQRYIDSEDDPEYVIPVTRLQLEIILDYVSIEGPI